MSVYIDRDQLEDFAMNCVGGMVNMKQIHDFPAADVVERKTGTWGKENECSECGCQPWFYHDIHTLNFCPNCGAEMRGG